MAVGDRRTRRLGRHRRVDPVRYPKVTPGSRKGDGYSIHTDHLMSDRAGSFVDVVIVTLEAE